MRAVVNEVIEQTRYMRMSWVRRVCMNDTLEHIQLEDRSVDSILVVIAVGICCANFQGDMTIVATRALADRQIRAGTDRSRRIFCEPNSTVDAPPEFAQNFISTGKDVSDSDRVVAAATIPIAGFFEVQREGWPHEPCGRHVWGSKVVEPLEKGSHVIGVSELKRVHRFTRVTVRQPLLAT